jgi:hypothetical protein
MYSKTTKTLDLPKMEQKQPPGNGFAPQHE